MTQQNTNQSKDAGAPRPITGTLKAVPDPAAARSHGRRADRTIAAAGIRSRTVTVYRPMRSSAARATCRSTNPSSPASRSPSTRRRRRRQRLWLAPAVMASPRSSRARSSRPARVSPRSPRPGHAPSLARLAARFRRSNPKRRGCSARPGGWYAGSRSLPSRCARWSWWRTPSCGVVARRSGRTGCSPVSPWRWLFCRRSSR